MNTHTPVILVTGNDERGNSFRFWKSAFGWADGYNECITDENFIRRHVYPNVQKAIIGRVTMTGAEWIAEGCPISMTQEQIAAFEQEHRPHAIDEADALERTISAGTQKLIDAGCLDAKGNLIPYKSTGRRETPLSAEDVTDYYGEDGYEF